MVRADTQNVLTATIASVLGDVFGQIRLFIILWIPPLLLGFLVYLMWRLVKMMPRTAPAELKPDEESIVRWHDVAGVEEAKAELAEIIEFLRDPARFDRLGARVPRGVLLHGPPGTGKTLLAKAVAAESGAAFFSQPASAFVEMFAGLGASRIRKLFDTARKHAPAIVFIDELDAVGAARQNVGFNREQDQTLNQLLVELDGFNRSDVVIMASTNRLDTLDAALLRPGRFDRQVYVSPPDLLAREQILNVHVRNKPIDESVDLNSIARATAGLTGADLENICNEAAIRATRAGRDSLTAVDFDDALERVVAGLKTHRMVSEQEKRVIAYHEAGHAVLAHIVGRGMAIHKVTIVPRGRALGYNMYLPTDERVLATRDDLITNIVVLLGGRAAEQVALGEVSNGAGDDLERCTAIARAMVFDWGLGESLTTRTVRADNFALSEDTKRQRDQEQSQICDYAYSEATRLLEEHREALERLASKLLERETLDREDVATMLHDVERRGYARLQPPGRSLRARRGSRPDLAHGLVSSVSVRHPRRRSRSPTSWPRPQRERRARAPRALRDRCWTRACLPRRDRTPPTPNAALALTTSPSSLRRWQLEQLRLDNLLDRLERVRRLLLDLVLLGHVCLPLGSYATCMIAPLLPLCGRHGTIRACRRSESTTLASPCATSPPPELATSGSSERVSRRTSGSRNRASRRSRCCSARAVAWSCWRRSPRTPRSGASSRAAARECTTLRSASTTCLRNSVGCRPPGRR